MRFIVHHHWKYLEEKLEGKVSLTMKRNTDSCMEKPLQLSEAVKRLPETLYVQAKRCFQWSRNDIHIGGAKRGVVDCFYDFGVKSHKIIY